MVKKTARILFALGLATGFLLSPYVALATPPPTDTASWNFYQFPDQTVPNAISSQFNLLLKNTTNTEINTIEVTVPNMNACMIITGITASYQSGANISTTSISTASCTSGVSSFQITALHMSPGSVMSIFLNADIGCITYSTSTSCDPNPLATASGNWRAHMYHYDGGGFPFADNIPVGNTLTTITNTPNPTQQPLNWGQKNPYGDALQESGLSSPDLIKGLLPPGPIDALLTLPITLLQIIISAAHGNIIAPTFTLFGYAASLPSGQTFWNAVPAPIPSLVSTMFIFLIGFSWTRSVYDRLQRASQFNTHVNDTWGLL